MLNTENQLETTNPPQDWLNFGAVKEDLIQLVSSWETRTKETTRRRDIRDIKVDNDAMRKIGKIGSDETYIPVRMVDANIKRLLPSLIGYLKQSRRTAVFKVVGDDGQPTEYIEREYTRVTRYDGWENDFYKTFDGSAAHGWASVEICYDKDAPGRFRFDYVPHDQLIFPEDAIELEAQEYIEREFRMTKTVLTNLVKTAGWNAAQVSVLIEKQKQNKLRSGIVVYKHFCKIDGIVYVGWWSRDCDDWLKVPEIFFNGIGELKQVPAVDPLTGQPQIDQNGQPVMQQQLAKTPETQYPFEIFFWDITEKVEICKAIGMTQRDEYKQEAASGIWSAYVNGSYRASCIYPYRKSKSPISSGTSSSKQAKIVLQHGVINDDELGFMNIPYPDASMVRATQALETQNAQENNQVNFAVQNRQDSRKTAEEIKQASQQNSLISSVNVTLLSGFLRNLYRRAFKIVKAQALSNTGMEFCAAQPEVISLNYDIRAAGDTDVIERAEKVDRMGQMLGIVTGTGAELQFKADLIRLALPDSGDVYAQLIIQNSPEHQLIQTMAQMIQGAVMGPNGQIKPEFAAMAPQLQQLAQNVQSVLSGNTGAR